MSEIISRPQPIEASRIQDKDLAHLGALITAAAMREDLAGTVSQHKRDSGVGNPNSIGRGLFVGKGEVPMDDNKVYRSVTELAALDLAQSSVVRGAKLAGVEGSKTNGNTTYWSNGEAGKSTPLGQGVIIEASLQDAKDDWVSADKVVGVYARDSDGDIKNLIPDREP